MTAPARVREADIARATRQAKKNGAKRVRVDLTAGTIDIVLEDNQIERFPLKQHGPIQIEDHPEKKLVF